MSSPQPSPHAARTAEPAQAVVADVGAMTCAELVRLRVRAAALRRLAWLQHLWDGSSPGPDWGWTLQSPDTTAAERAWRAVAPEARPFSHALRAAEAALAGSKGGPRRRLRDIYALSDPELDLLDAAAAIATEPDLQPIFAAIDPASTGSAVREATALRLFDADVASAWRPAGPLARWQLLHETRGPRGSLFVADGFATRMLDGVLTLDRELHGCAQLVEPRFELEQWPLERTAAAAADVLDRAVPLRVAVRSRPGDGARDFAGALARRLGMAALHVDPPGGTPPDALRQSMRLAERIALAGGYALVGPGCFWRAGELGAEGAPIHVALLSRAEGLPEARDRAELWVELPMPSTPELAAVWRALAGNGDGDALEVPSLVGRRGSRAEDVAALARIGRARTDEALSGIRARIRNRIAEVGRLAETLYGWDDLVLASSTREELEHIAFEARVRLNAGATPVAGPGMSALFHGPPGTGKTMAAQALAREIGTELLVVDVAGIVSKYVGETAKNLRRLFEAVCGSDAILMFDEADSFFARRTELKDAQDKHSNADTNFLLQLLDSFDGVAILATNKRSNIDPAFFRRIRHVVEFRLPRSPERLEMWRRMLARLQPQASTRPEEPLLVDVADAVDFSQAQIRSAATTAHFHALRAGSALDRGALLSGIERELAKEGRRLDRSASSWGGADA